MRLLNMPILKVMPIDAIKQVLCVDPSVILDVELEKESEW